MKCKPCQQLLCEYTYYAQTHSPVKSEEILVKSRQHISSENKKSKQQQKKSFKDNYSLETHHFLKYFVVIGLVSVMLQSLHLKNVSHNLKSYTNSGNAYGQS